MQLTKIALWGHYCHRCGHRWVPRGLKPPLKLNPPLAPEDPGEMPESAAEQATVCPRCKSPYWASKRRDEAAQDEAPVKKPRPKPVTRQK